MAPKIETKIYRQYEMYQLIQRNEFNFIKQQELKIIGTIVLLWMLWNHNSTIILKFSPLISKFILMLHVIFSGIIFQNIWSKYNIISITKKNIVGLNLTDDIWNEIYSNNFSKVKSLKFSIINFLPYYNRESFKLFCNIHKIENESEGIYLILNCYIKTGDFIAKTFIILPSRVFLSILLYNFLYYLICPTIYFIFGNIYGDIIIIFVIIKIIEFFFFKLNSFLKIDY